MINQIKKLLAQRKPDTVVGLVALTLFYFLSLSPSSGQPKGDSNLYDRVMKSGKIRSAYGVYAPGCIKDLNTGKLSGIGVEALELVAKKLGLSIDWTEEVSWGSMIEGLQTGRYDIIVTPIWTQASRARLAGFSRPLYFSPLFAYVKFGDKRLNANNLASINSPRFTIATLDGATAQSITNEDFPRARQVSLPQQTDVSQLLLTVSTGKADLTFTEPADAIRFLKYNPASLQQVPTPRPVRVFPNCWMFARGQYEFKMMLDTVLDEIINSGAMEKIIRKYEPVPNSLYRVALPYQPPSLKGTSQAADVLKKR